MLALHQLHDPTLIAYTLSKTLNPIFTIPISRPLFPSTLPVLSLSSSSFSHQDSYFTSRRNFTPSTPPCCARQFSGSGSPDSEEALEGFEDRDEADYFDSGNSDVDVTGLEQEAKDAVREYSKYLSRVLTIDEKDDPKETTQMQKTRSRASNVPDNFLPRVAIVGRPNVGKSALFNRLVGGDKAIVVNEPGVTRDRLYGRSFWGDHEFMVVDTGGVLTLSKSQAGVMEELAISTTVGMDGIPLASREAAVARMPSMIERQAAAAVE